MWLTIVVLVKGGQFEWHRLPTELDYYRITRTTVSLLPAAFSSGVRQPLGALWQLYFAFELRLGQFSLHPSSKLEKKIIWGHSWDSIQAGKSAVE